MPSSPYLGRVQLLQSPPGIIVILHHEERQDPLGTELSVRSMVRRLTLTASRRQVILQRLTESLIDQLRLVSTLSLLIGLLLESHPLIKRL